MNVGFLGASKIGHKMANIINQLPDFNNYAVASRDIVKAKLYQEELGFKLAYGSYEELLKDDNVDLVYVSTIHSLHYDHLELCLKYHKNVLCEKILTTSYEETIKIYQKFEDAGLFLAEALWTSYMPSRFIINDLLYKDALIGGVKRVEASFLQKLTHVDRLINKDLGGGALFDIGVYPLSFIFRILGFDFSTIKLDDYYVNNNVDYMEKGSFYYSNGKVGIIKADIREDNTSNVIVYGEKGKMVIDSVTNPSLITIYNLNNEIMKKFNLPSNIGGFEYELYQAKEAIENKCIEPKMWTHKESILLAKAVNQILNEMKF